MEEKTHLSDRDIRKKKRNKIILTVLFVLVNIGAILITGIIEFTKDEVEYIDFLGLNMTFLIAAVGCIAAAIFFETQRLCVRKSRNEKNIPVILRPQRKTTPNQNKRKRRNRL